MGSGSRQPFMYEPVRRDDDRFPQTPFDPKAVTRASYEAKKPKPKPTGPLVSINRHPDTHVVFPGRGSFQPMSHRTKNWIKAMRVVQLCLRLPQVTAAAGLIVVMILAGLMSGLFAWIMGATLGVAIIHCCYSIYHHARPAGRKPPGSAAAYQFFSALSDLGIPPLYAYGAYTTRGWWDEWKMNPELAQSIKVKYMMPSVHYAMVGAGGLHLLSLAISLWLGFMYRRISKMPPDLNPLEAHLTSRVSQHKRNKSSVATTTTAYSDEKRDRQQLYDDAESPRRSVPFMHTRQGSDSTLATKDSRLNLPSRQYQIAPGNQSSATSQNLKRMSAPPSSTHRASYTEIPLEETGASSSNPASPPQTTSSNLPRPARFTETWYASDSLISRTQQRNRRNNRAAALAAKNNTPQRTAYASLDATDSSSSDSDNDSENDNYYTAAPSARRSTLGNNSSGSDTENWNRHPNPLRSHPANFDPNAITPPTTTDDENTTTSASNAEKKSTPRRPRTPFSRLRASRILADVSLNDRRGSGDDGDGDEQDIADMKNRNFQPRNRLSSIQPDADFYAKPYGELKPATPPIMVGPGGVTLDVPRGSRQVSSGCDFGDLGNAGRRRVSARAAEEGMAWGY